MCGFAGYAQADSSPLPLEGLETLQRMTSSLFHRGPDAEGYWIDGNVALGHRRLAIIDIAGGRQPMVQNLFGLAIVFNGEIYNYLEINDELASLGFGSTTRSDTETILLAYAAWGPSCVKKFNGMFSFVIHDKKNHKLFAARDRTGKKPFYYYHNGPLVIFASEPKAILQHDRVRRELNLNGFAKYLLFEHVPSPHSIFRGIQKLCPGQRLEYDLLTGNLRLDVFWDHQIDPTCDHMSLPGVADECYWTERIIHLLKKAVARRLISDVPLGVFLSGGLDSSAIAAVMCELCGGKNVKTFSIGFDVPSFDESPYARQVADFLGTDHHEYVLTAGKVRDILPECVDTLDEPFADPSILPCYFLARNAREHVTVALGGDGGDELFAGYATFKALGLAKWYNALVPAWLHRRVVRPVTGLLPVSFRDFSLDFKIKQFLRGVKVPEEERLWRWLGSFAAEELHSLLSRDALLALDLRGLYADVRSFAQRVAGFHPVVRDGYLYSKTYLSDQILFKLDRSTMASSLEARCPLLDPEMIDLADAIPGNLKYRKGSVKHIFKKALQGLLPREILARPKKGFGMPVASWLGNELRDFLQDTLSESRLREGGLFNPVFVRKLIDEHLQGKRDHRKPIWTLLMFESWRATWLSSKQPTCTSYEVRAKQTSYPSAAIPPSLAA
jgi:asparagine synthase (glutamine-hydrolysing)